MKFPKLNLGKGGKKEPVVTSAPQPAPEVKEPPKPKEYNVITAIVTINNVTDKEYRFESTNEYGLKWEYVKDDGEKSARNDLLCIQQKKDYEGAGWIAVARLYNFSIVRLERKTVTIQPDGN